MPCGSAALWSRDALIVRYLFQPNTPVSLGSMTAFLRLWHDLRGKRASKQQATIVSDATPPRPPPPIARAASNASGLAALIPHLPRGPLDQFSLKDTQFHRRIICALALAVLGGRHDEHLYLAECVPHNLDGDHLRFNVPLVMHCLRSLEHVTPHHLDEVWRHGSCCVRRGSERTEGTPVECSHSRTMSDTHPSGGV
ncbi:hypothetical protein B0H19DRAFT_1273267 [Mycena capillaripes]|nr:hypothetical protein B0H19DRAFT_1273267 [Mycena capillaripes]